MKFAGCGVPREDGQASYQVHTGRYPGIKVPVLVLVPVLAPLALQYSPLEREEYGTSTVVVVVVVVVERDYL